MDTVTRVVLLEGLEEPLTPPSGAIPGGEILSKTEAGGATEAGTWLEIAPVDAREGKSGDDKSGVDKSGADKLGGVDKFSGVEIDVRMFTSKTGCAVVTTWARS